jgi:AcrR family transcriptional regulator
MGMVRLTRAQQQERTRSAVLAAAEREFAEQGYADAKVDRIAERAELTRGAVYSNFPSKRALYLAVLVHLVERDAPAVPAGPAGVGAFARAWLERLPMATDPPGGHLRLRSLAGVLDDEPIRATFAQLTRLEAQLLAFALEAGRPGRQVRLAELVLTLLTGAGQLAEAAPGFGDPFDVIRACERLAEADLDDSWAPPHLPYIAPATPCDEEWAGPAADGVVVVLGTARLAAVEEAVRAVRPGDQLTVAVVTGDPAELGRLVRLRVSDLTGCLHRVFAPDLPLRLVLEGSELAAAAGVEDADDTEAAVRVRAGRIVARADGRGAGHAAATATVPAR